MMGRLRGQIAMFAVLLVLMLAGCGSQEVIMKEFISEDGTVSINMDETWIAEDMGAGREGWIAAFNEDGSEGITVVQLVKVISNVIDMDACRELIENSYLISGMSEINKPSIQGMEVERAYSCAITADGLKGVGRVVYGETEYAYYCILFLYAEPKVNDYKAEYFNNVCESFKVTEPEIKSVSTVENTDTIQWFNNTCALRTAEMGWDYTMFGGLPASDASLRAVKTLLDMWLGITDRECADELIEWYLTEGYRVSFTDDIEYLIEVGVADIAAEERVDYLLENFDIGETEALSYANGLTIYDQHGEDAIAAWDYGSVMSLLSYCYLAGYYTEEEALDKSMEVASIIQSTYDSWDDFMESYFAGDEYCSGESCSERRKIYEEIKAASDSPYSIEWSLALEKSW